MINYPPQKPPLDAVRDQMEMKARINGPARRNMAVHQADGGHLPLFIAANEPRLL